ncbi:MAG TPA: helix-turn-helix domain-containing protein [Myxococcota bacterium]|nr:helix-turn-helix transcriptional regulator [Myxococcota bacterium]HNZ03691.1 helix-turn-helix domain-containing protein [Myxococcota bacterium]HOD07884.1 helix-turn-helix domain-containing protein [Myxococcota bacterium]HPB51247.1 helix-turn-helix domain-containing protein [Myxococcota bacterium]
MKIKTTEELGAAIRSRRKELKVSQKDLAFASGTGLRFIIELEKGKATCQSGKILDVLQALGIGLHVDSVARNDAGGER